MPVIQGMEWTFDTRAQLYEKMRPGYVKALYEDIFSRVPLNGESRAVEIGIGGGQATEPVLQTGCQVLAVEYGENFSRLCREKFRKYPNFSVVTSKFEDYPWDGTPCDLIFSASALLTLR